MADKRLAEWTIVIHDYLGWKIYDVHLGYWCDCCHGYGTDSISNASHEEIAYLASFPEAKFGWAEMGEYESWLRLMRDLDQGAYSPEGHWIEWPTYQPEIADLEQGVTRRQGQTVKLAMWFVREILHSYNEQRVWQTTDFSGVIMKQSADLLKRYDADTIAGCLEANRDGVIGDGFDLTFISAIEKSGEPSLIQQWLDYCNNPPAVYLEYETQQWLARKNKHYPELEPDPQTAPAPKTKSTRKKKVKATQLELE